MWVVTRAKSAFSLGASNQVPSGDDESVSLQLNIKSGREIWVNDAAATPEGAHARTDVEEVMAAKATQPGYLLTRCRETDFMRVASAQCCR